MALPRGAPAPAVRMHGCTEPESTCHLPSPQPPAPPQVQRTLGGGGPAASSWLQGGHLPRCPLPRPPQCAGERRARQMAWLRMRRRCREVRAGTGDMRLRASWCHCGGGGEAGEVSSPPPGGPPVLTPSSLSGSPALSGPRPRLGFSPTQHWEGLAGAE